MDGKGNNRRAYAPGDDTTLTVQEDGKSGGKCSFCTPKRLVCATVTAVAIIIIIVITAVLSSKNNENDKVVQGIPNVASSVTQEMTTTLPPPTTTTTFGPAVIGSFKGTFVMNKAYGTFFDDVRAPMTIAFKNNFTAAMDEVYNVPRAALYVYQETIVDQLVQNGTNVQVKFTVSLDAINRGGRGHLVTTLGSFPSNTMNTYAVLYADIEPEKEPSLGA